MTSQKFLVTSKRGLVVIATHGLLTFQGNLTNWTAVFHCVCPVIEFRHNIVKVAVDPRGDSRVDPHLL